MSAALRKDARVRLGGILLGIVVGTLLGGVHWVGLFVGGAVAGLPQRTTRRGVGAGALAGLGVWCVFLAGLWGDGALVAAVGSMPIIAVSVAIAVAYGAAGGLFRGLI
ncbi:hypothetical protein [Natronomonas sp. EA1]|uniref:hypothetical protein n=1 Tax=Natronomonas sp. EA1 TaxID=3421655 RepID=UPI003EBF1DA1